MSDAYCAKCSALKQRHIAKDCELREIRRKLRDAQNSVHALRIIAESDADEIEQLRADLKASQAKAYEECAKLAKEQADSYGRAVAQTFGQGQMIQTGYATGQSACLVVERAIRARAREDGVKPNRKDGEA